MRLGNKFFFLTFIVKIHPVKIFLKPLLILLPLVVGLFLMNSCHKEQFSKSGALSFSTDTLTFDTVFTTLGSTTKYFMIRNNQSKSLNISDIKLMQLSGSQFRINVDGVNGTEFKNVDIPAHDSLYVFVEVTIQPNNINNPFVIFDQVQFITNGVTQKVVLEAMGQNAYYHFSDSIIRDTTWHNDKPHIIVNRNGGLPILEIKQGRTLTLLPGTQIYMGPNAVITVDGGLVSAPGGSWSDSIKFQYIRTDYPNQPGQWLGITYSRSANINLNHVIIDQSTFGISDEYVLDILANALITTSDIRNYASNPIPTVTLDKVIIRNASSSAMTAIRTNLTATNSLFTSASGQLVVLGMGGTYHVDNCTIANGYSQYVTHQSPSLTLLDQIYYIDRSTKIGPYATTATFNNTIVTGNISGGNEIGFGLGQQSSDAFTFNNCFLTSPRDSVSAYAVNNNNIDTAGDPMNVLRPSLFKAPYSNNYMPDSSTIVLQYVTSPVSGTDLFDYPRPTPRSSIGAIEWHQ
jgi:hypothetical protein